MTIADTDIFLADIEAAEETLHVSGGGPDSGGTDGYTTGGSDTPAATKYPPRLQQLSMLSRTMFGDRTTSGQSTVSVGDVVLRNEDFGLDRYKRYAFDGRRIVVRRGAVGAAYPAAFTTVLDATMGPPTWDGALALKIRDNQNYLDVPLQTTTYAGDNAAPNGLEGTPDDLKGKLKPVCVCGATNIPPPCVNAPKLIWQVHDGAIYDVTAVRDRGAPLGTGLGFSPIGGSIFGVDTAVSGYSLANKSSTIVLVGYDASTNAAKIATSADGISWTTRTAPGGVQGLQAVAANSSLFVAVGGISTGYIITSPDGITWTSRTSPFAAAVTPISVVWGSAFSLWVIGTADGKIATSPDGITWTTRTSPFGGTDGLYAIAAGAGVVVLASTLGPIASSNDGITWTLRTANFGSINFTSIAYSSALHRFVGVGWNTGGSDAESYAVSDDGISWRRASSPFTGLTLSSASVCWDGTQFLSLSSNGSLGLSFDGLVWSSRIRGTDSPFPAVVFGQYKQVFSTGSLTLVLRTDLPSHSEVPIFYSSARTYANTTELLDDTKAPLPGTYAVCPSAGYFRLGSPPDGAITCDVLQGATAADRTAAQAFVIANTRAGNTTGDWSASDVTALDAADDSEVEFWLGPDDTGVTCADVADAAARTVGAGWWADTNGVLRIRRLTAPDTNLVTSPDVVTAGAGWTIGGSGVGTAGFSNVGGVPLTRLSVMTGVGASRGVTLAGSTVKRFAIMLQWDGVAGTSVHGLFDNTAAAFIAAASVVWTSAGVATATVTNGSLVRFFQIGPTAYALVLDSTAANAAHTHSAHALAGGAIASLRVGRVTVYDAVPLIALDENDLVSNLTPVPSGDPNGGISQNKTSLRYAHNHTVQTTDLAGIVTDEDRVFYGLEWREAVASDSAVLTRHPLSQPTSIDTLYRFEADAQAEATRRQALFGADREWYECGVAMTTATVALDLGDVVELAHERFGLGPAARLRILGIKPELQESARESRIMLTLWK